MMGTIYTSVRRLRRPDPAALKRSRKLLLQELDKRVCFNIDYGTSGDEAFLELPVEVDQVVLEQQLAFLSQVATLNSLGQISLPKPLSDAIQLEIQDLSSNLVTEGQESDEKRKPAISSDTTASDMLADDSLGSNDSVELAITSDAIDHLIGLNYSDQLYGVVLANFDTVLNSYFANYREFVEDLFQTTNASGSGSVGVSAGQDNPSQTTTDQSSNQSDQVQQLDSKPPTPAIVAAPPVSPSTSTPFTEVRPGGLSLQPALTNRSQSTLAQPEFVSNSVRDAATESIASTWFVRNNSSTHKTNNPETNNSQASKLTSARTESRAVRMQRAHMTIARSRPMTSTAETGQVAQAEKISVQPELQSESTPETHSKSNDYIAPITTPSVAKAPHVKLQPLSSTDFMLQPTEDYIGDVRSFNQASQNRQNPAFTPMPSEAGSSDLTSLLVQQVPLAAVIAIGLLKRRDTVEKEDRKWEEFDLRATKAK